MSQKVHQGKRRKTPKKAKNNWPKPVELDTDLVDVVYR